MNQLVPGSSPLHVLSWKKGAEETKNNEIKFTRKIRMETSTDMVDSVIHQTVDNVFCYIDTVEMTGFLLLLKNHIFTAHSEDTVFIFHV